MIAIINGCGNNIASIQLALARLGQESVLSTEPEIIASASHVILPGVESAGRAMKRLNELGFISLLQQLTKPVLGICVGMQILFEYSEENSVECLGIFSGKVSLLTQKKGFSIPHMGWNKLKIQSKSDLLDGIQDGSFVYFVHSYGAQITDNTMGITHYTEDFSAVVQKNNYYGLQFHPERSGPIGARILKNFVSLK